MTRLANLVHHIVTTSEPSDLGVTRLAKILWFADVEYFRRTGQTITHSDDYRKDDHGPRHSEFYSSIDRLVKEGKVVERPTLTGVGTTRRELISITLPDVNDFSAEEIATVDRIASSICSMTAKQASELTHDELWDSAYHRERIPVSAAAVVPGDITPEIMEWAESVCNEDRTAS